MTVQYNIRAKPTVLNGIHYRSRLEAKWAAFFTLAGWKFEYEPFDLDEWCPDFYLRPSGAAEGILVEVKPIDDMDLDTCLRMERAAKSAGCAHELLLLGMGPGQEDGLSPWGGCQFGWLGERYEDQGLWWQPASFGTCGGYLDFGPESGAYIGRLTGGGYRDLCGEGATTFDIQRMWGLAGKLTQWQKKS